MTYVLATLYVIATGALMATCFLFAANDTRRGVDERMWVSIGMLTPVFSTMLAAIVLR